MKKILDNADRFFETFNNAPFDELKAEVLRTEEQIRNVVGQDADWVKIPKSDKQKEELKLLLNQRRKLLNRCRFSSTHNDYFSSC